MVRLVLPAKRESGVPVVKDALGEGTSGSEARRRAVAIGVVACALIAATAGLVSAQTADQRFSLCSILLRLSFGSLLFAGGILVLAGVLAVIQGTRVPRQVAQFGALAFGVLSVAVIVLDRAVTHLRLEAGMVVQVGADFVFIGGAMADDLVSQLDRAVHPSVELNRVILSNNGGSIRAAIDTAAWLAHRGVRRAVVEGDCASACALLALLMPERYLTPGAALGFHDLWRPGARRSAVEATRIEVLERLRANGVDADAIDRLMRGRELYFPPRPELLSKALVTGCWSESMRRPSACESVQLGASH